MTLHLDPAGGMPVRRKRGAQPGNRLALKTGRHTKEARAFVEPFLAQRRAIRAEMRRVLALVEALRATHGDQR